MTKRKSEVSRKIPESTVQIVEDNTFVTVPIARTRTSFFAAELDLPSSQSDRKARIVFEE
ncbi:MAG: hypothetical protein V1799_16575 [bacterium]